ncbi:fatty acid desaturase [Vogesella sp. DC21W]|uniref:Fatty acid desaturase n=1 Tax=Vogesella aquatica TaxID=2984206 RepID=A0ABT5J165_9NEIS|nr:fatty acid desaturase [Vogesella aquatica]MDC7718590.1 fatty acid desaturase [Vogesella aquatica]
MYCTLQHASALPDTDPATPRPPAWLDGTSNTAAGHSEWPTWLLIATIYGGWIATVTSWQQLGPWLGTPLLIVFTCWYLSLQHELIHGHPTRHAWFNALLGLAPLAVWYPFAVYRDTHLAHHNDEALTLPGIDPESYYRQNTPLSGTLLALYRWRNTAPGRLLIGPAWGWLSTLGAALRHGGWPEARVWLGHAVLLAALLWLLAQAGIHPLYYLLAVAYPALALAMVRSFYEHRAADAANARSVLNEAAWPWRLLFLNLNYHLVHHLHPGIPWFRLRQVYLTRRAHYQTHSDGFVEHGYLPLLWRHRRQPVIADFHPFA